MLDRINLMVSARQFRWCLGAESPFHAGNLTRRPELREEDCRGQGRGWLGQAGMSGCQRNM